MSELGDATVDTWEAAKTASAWTGLKTAYAEAKGRPATAPTK